MSFIYCDYPKRWQTGFQDPATPVMEGIIDLHHSIFFFLIIIASFNYLTCKKLKSL